MAFSEPTPSTSAEAQIVDRAVARAINDSLADLSERQRISVGLSIILGVERPAAVAGLLFAKGRIAEHADILARGAFDGEQYR
ncbi:hypothetical protein [uncultured Tateyamaria sp.]|uniref:hypothetical protein n=1 Tax=uncultured Tateyamaria sp. TaxID=455651 RepID=UPI00260913FC|nr:hypothetical protein [uncultured Tateyamaria sp.]